MIFKLRDVPMALLDLFFPETCMRCGVERDGHPWSATERRVGGLRFWDSPHLCADCGRSLGSVCMGSVPLAAGGFLPVGGGAPASEDLVALVGRFKYKGIRGLGWPLARLLTEAVTLLSARHGTASALIPVPLHGSRRRERGFNQANLLANLVAGDLGIPVRADILRRTRATRRQASLATGGRGRDHNVTGVFQARKWRAGDPQTVMLIDDLLTTGATVAAATATLLSAGWQVTWGAAVGLASRLQSSAVDQRAGPELDTDQWEL